LRFTLLGLLQETQTIVVSATDLYRRPGARTHVAVGDNQIARFQPFDDFHLARTPGADADLTLFRLLA
jgi:hypothetical protein